MSRQISFDIIKYVNIIKILQGHWCSQQYLESNVTFSLFYLFDWKFVDLMFFSFLPGKTCAPEKSSAPRKFCAPEQNKSLIGICLGLLYIPSRRALYILTLYNLPESYHGTETEKANERTRITQREIGQTFKSLAFQFPILCSGISHIVIPVYETLIQHVGNKYLKTSSTEE